MTSAVNQTDISKPLNYFFCKTSTPCTAGSERATIVTPDIFLTCI